jgi:glycosyltransferase involved in cell wall biosynthesis
MDPRIEIINEVMSSSNLRALIAKCDVVLSPHRAEGFGLTLAEAMMFEKLVIATGWSGNLEFMNAQNSVLLPYRLIAVKDPPGVYSGEDGAQWADPDLTAGATSLRQLAYDVARRMELGRRARRDVVFKLAPENWKVALREAGFNV